MLERKATSSDSYEADDDERSIGEIYGSAKCQDSVSEGEEHENDISEKDSEWEVSDFLFSEDSCDEWLP